jgi:hypothetical protein
MLKDTERPEPQCPLSSCSPIAFNAYHRAKRIKENIAAGDKACVDAEERYMSAGQDEGTP